MGKISVGPVRLSTVTIVEAFDAGRPRRLGDGAILSVLCMVFASTVAVCSYVLNSIANHLVDMGLTENTFTTNQWDVPVHTLLRGSADASFHGTGIVSLSDLLYTACDVGDDSCAAAFLPQSNYIWSLVGRALGTIPAFVDLGFQAPASAVRFQHVNSLSGWNKALAQFYIDGHTTAITCIVRRTSFTTDDHATIDTLAYCAPRPYDPNWLCENDVPDTTDTFVLRMTSSVATYLGMVPLRDVYFNPGYVATARGGPLGDVVLRGVPAMDEYQVGILQAQAPWDVVCLSSCATYDPDTRLGWLLQMRGKVSMMWICDSLMLTNTVLLWCLTTYLLLLQRLFLWHSHVCVVAVYLSKNVLGITVLFVSFYGNKNLQTLAAYLAQNPASTPLGAFYPYAGPAQMASIVGIMTGQLVQMWFTPRLVTQTWLLSAASLLNWILVFYLEAFVFPIQNRYLSGTCALATSSNCISLSAIAQTRYMSAVVAAAVIVATVGAVYFHSWLVPDDINLPPTNSVLRYLDIPSLRAVVTSGRGVVHARRGTVVVDEGVLLMKNVLRVSERYLTRLCNAQFSLAYWAAHPSWRRAPAKTGHTILVVHVDDDHILPQSSYVPVHSVHLSVDCTRGLC
ncbi:hypothetical protein ACHHYP_11492 [Achlya hypogyna]|uniref:Transmembrane protein n=1 Tax=Achlya hypogyna TaxID=1202772 RepID=A0A1V9YJ75_ACHHY|nr:hypothetical protein ACHHYP_11492 [Achlya hypogyna]